MPDLFKQFSILTPDLAINEHEVTPDFYEMLDREYDSFSGHTLISAHRFTGDWPTWEIHPRGDELVVLMSGEAEFLLRQDGQDTSVVLNEPGSYVLVPRATWHTAKIENSASMLFITPGEGTLNEEEPPNE